MTPEVKAFMYKMSLPDTLVSCLKNRTYGISPTSYPGEEISTFCVQQYIWETSKEIFHYEVSDDTARWILNLFEKGRRLKEEQLRVRKEYRMLTKYERINYHKAVTMLKSDTSVHPNKYDAIADFHRGDSIKSAHFGPPFPGWHRVFCLIFEEALREKIPTVTLPYWDPTLDNEMDNPVDSILFTKHFVGNPDGLVTTGPFANWHHEQGGPLCRNVGAFGRLINREDIANIMSRTYQREITDQTSSELICNLEAIHGHVHTFVGGNMGRLRSAAEDPLFFNIHAFIDCVWEQFRMKQMMNGIDPSKDYPATDNPFHHPYRLMDGFVNENYTNIDGYSHHFTRDIYTCQEFPTCSSDYPDCGSPWLYCDQTKWVCVSKSNKDHHNRLESTPVVLNTVQNKFEINGRADIDGWVYLTVKIILERPPSVKFKSYAIRNGRASNSDVYGRIRGSDMNTQSVPGNPKSYAKHTVIGSGFEKVYVQSDGLNYIGTSLDYAIIDERFAVTEAFTYVPVKDPGCGVTEVLLTAFDSGGRLCRPYCKLPDSSSKFGSCSGALTIDAEFPHFFGKSYADNILNRYKFENDFPYSREMDVFIVFFCNFQEVWPW